MGDRFKFGALRHIVHLGAVPEIDMVNGCVLGETGNVCVLNLRIVKIIKVIENGDFMSGREQLLDKMRPNETSATGHENSHAARLTTDRHRSTQILNVGIEQRKFVLVRGSL